MIRLAFVLAVILFEFQCVADCKGLKLSSEYVDFTLEHGVRCRLTAEGDAMWRLRTSKGDGFSERGAAQALAAWMGEEIKCAPQRLRHRKSGDIHSFKSSDGSLAVLRLSPFSLAFFSDNGKKTLEINNIDSANDRSILGGNLLTKEAVFGLGQRFDRLNKRGQRCVLYSSDGYNDSNSTYMPIPLFMTTRGGGVFLNVAERMSADFGVACRDAWLIEIERKTLDAYVIATDRIRDVPARYHRLTGKPRLPEEWNYGPIVCRYSPDLTVMEGPTSRLKGKHRFLGWGVKDILERYRSIGALPTAMILEGWSTDVFSRRNNESLKAVSALLSRDGIRTMIWMRCGAVISRNAPGFKKEYEVHVDVTDGKGNVKTANTTLIPNVSMRGGNPDVSGKKAHSVLDITNPEAWKWYVSTVWKALIDCGVSGAKIDFCEELPDDDYLYGNTRVRYKWKDHSVFSGTAIHHAYPVFFVSKLSRDLSAMLKEKGGFMPLVRGGGLGAQRNSFMWAGDQQRCLEKLDDQILAVLNSGISGVPFMTYDMAGYQYPNVVNEPVGVWNKATRKIDFSRRVAGKGDEVVYLRRSRTLSIEDEASVFSLGSAFTAYMPCFQTHGFVRNPYDFPESTLSAYKSAVLRHSSLGLIRKKAARKAVEVGMPLVRPLVMEWQDDENTWDIFDEFLYGDDFLVAPSLSYAKERDVYLPEGRWRELDTGKIYNVSRGGIHVKKAISVGKIAVYKREEF